MKMTLKRWPNGPAKFKGPYLLGPGTAYQDLKGQGRQVGFRFDSNGTGDFWRLGQVRYDLSPGPLR